VNLLTPAQQELVTELRRQFGRGALNATSYDPVDHRITDRLDVVIALLWDINSKLGEGKKR
jgi:hypothetical protein